MDKVQITTDSSACKICMNCEHAEKINLIGWVCFRTRNADHIGNPYCPACQHFTQKGESHE